jgi:diguanylate cyclase (GGDEF)-like protein
MLAEAYLEIHKIGRAIVGNTTIKLACLRGLRKTVKWNNHHAAALRVTAKYYATTGRERKAAAYFQKSIRHSAILGRRFEIAMGLYEYGLFLDRTNRSESAILRLTVAKQIFSELGAAAYVRRIESILGATEDANIHSLRSLIDRQRLYSIIRVSQDISSTLNLDVLLEKVMTSAIEITGAQRGVLMMADDPSGELEIVARKNINPGGSVDKSEILMEIAMEVHRTGKPKLIMNAMEDEHYARLPGVARYGLKSILCIPLKQKDKTMGVCYLDNPLSESVFTEEIQDVIGIIMTQAAISIEIVRLYELGITDGLTKLSTHRHFQDGLQKEISKSDRYSRDLSLIMMDIDKFKDFNDRYGHQAGDEVLKAVSHIILGNCRDIDIAARYGGEELAIILPETPHYEAMIVAERIRSAVEDTIIEFQSRKLGVSISIGIASYPTHARDRQSLIKAADDALYRSKKEGRNRGTVSDARYSAIDSVRRQ